MEQSKAATVDDNMETAGKTVPKEYFRRMEADVAAIVRSKDVFDGDSVCIGKGVHAVELSNG